MKSHHFITSGLSRTTCVARRACLAAFALVFCVRSTTALAAPMQWTVNGHWYEYVDASVTWNDAFAAAHAAYFMDMPGYLATVTSGSENYFVSVEVAKGKLAFLGGSDAGAAVNDWTWRNGPEVGSRSSTQVGTPVNRITAATEKTICTRTTNWCPDGLPVGMT